MREPTRVVNLGGSATKETVNASDLHLPAALTRAHRFHTCYDLGVCAVFVNILIRWAAMDDDLHTKRIRRAAQSLEGLSCGDAFGERFFLPVGVAESMIQEQAVPAPPWFFHR
jgi:hypothetical protein